MIPRETYVRITRRELPKNPSRENLPTFGLGMQPLFVAEGHLLEDLRVGAPIIFRACFRGGRPHHRQYKSGDVLRVEGEYVWTRKSLFQILRVPPFRSLDGVDEIQPAMDVDDLLSVGVKAATIRHSKNTFYRAVTYSVPHYTGYPDLSVLALMGYPFAQFQGFLRYRPIPGGTLNFLEEPAGRDPNRLIHMSSRIVSKQGEYCLTGNCLYRIQACRQ